MAAQAPLPRAVPIRTADGEIVSGFTSPPDWRDLKQHTGAMAALDVKAILDEQHHRAYGRPWVLGRCYFDELVARRLKPSERVLDLGCGAGRLGVWLIPFLEVGHYYGIDNHFGTLWAFASYECLLHNLFERQPNLMLDDDLRIDRFGVSFDVVLDFNVSVHLPMDKRERLFRDIAGVCTPGARLIMPRKPKVSRTLLPTLGFQLVNRGDVQYPGLEHWPVDPHATDRWYEFRLSEPG
ncbi:MAG: hypothetical protein A3F70_18315 [Acidobacteria bacterium RIFCSPLOWO2_12_FULL_67_14]|nr:MAG: hypothetical protein A3H29_11470 [Acidobacteria bacterium RIFCSPLOWO2_02_FULL_67_21]OFW38337.1 MAG: hypothetical protein A3F70_18315 [Acidobacteria bacterium RIFCSPLOWO2_12_FULL_67_14]